MSVTIAQQCLESESPYDNAVLYSVYRGMPNPSLKVFHFEDGSYLSFAITYTAIDAGRSLPCPPRNTI